MEEFYPEEQVINSLIGPGSKFKGDLEVQGLVRIDGDFSGTIQSTGKVLVGKYGRYFGTVSGRVIVIGGVFRGNMYGTHKVIILSDSIVLGNVYAPRLVIEEGAIVTGYLGITGSHRTIIKKNQSESEPKRTQEISVPSTRGLFSSKKTAKRTSL